MKFSMAYTEAKFEVAQYLKFIVTQLTSVPNLVLLSQSAQLVS